MKRAPRLVGGHRRLGRRARVGERRPRASERPAREGLARGVFPGPQRAADARIEVRPVGADAGAQGRIGAVERGRQRGDGGLGAGRGQRGGQRPHRAH